MLTVYTPTYNRAHLLPSLYKSMCRQTCKNFVWLIIDDGSNDNTEYLVKRWQNENCITIQYIYKENGGVHTARDLAYKLVKTELIVGIDSDDIAVDTFVEDITNYWLQYGGKDYAGIFARAQSPAGSGIGNDFPHVKAATYQELTYKYKFCGDKHTILRTDIIKKIPPSPVFPGEKLVGEGYKWIQLPDIPFLIFNKYTHIHQYLDDGYTVNTKKNLFNNLNGYRALYRQHIISSHYLKPKIKGHIGYIVTSLMLKDKTFIQTSPSKFFTLLFLPFGIAGYFYLIAKLSKYKQKLLF